MLFYIKVGRRCALSLEINRELSAKPLITKQFYKNETIIDLPFCRMIYTPAKRLDAEKDDAIGKQEPES